MKLKVFKPKRVVQVGVRSCVSVLLMSVAAITAADVTVLQEHCGECHTGRDPEGDFSLQSLGDTPDEESADRWISSLRRIEDGEMPPETHNRMTPDEVKQLLRYFRDQIIRFESAARQPFSTPPRRMNNREFENSLCKVLAIEHVGSHGPLKGLLGDTLHNGFDTHGETLGLSEYHLDQYVTAVRSVLDGMMIAGPKPEPQSITIDGDGMTVVDTDQRRRKDPTHRSHGGVEIRGPIERVGCDPFPSVPETGWYRIRVRAKALDRHIYDQARTGIYDGDPITLRMHLGIRHWDFDLPEDKVEDFESALWLVEGTTLEFSHATDGLRLIGNGNFKFQNRIAHDYIKANRPELYEHVVTNEVPKAKFRSESASHWVHWVPYWQGPRPWIESVRIDGPHFETWPPRRQIALIGNKPSIGKAAAILKPIAERAWRRPVSDQELAPFVRLAESQVETLGEFEAIKEGIVALLVSPSFLMINPEHATPKLRFATKLSYLIGSTTPDGDLIAKAQRNQLESVEALRQELSRRLTAGQMDEFLREFPYGWLQLDRINFMAPDIDRYPLYDKKRINEDMVDEVLRFFRHAIEANRPIPELLTADYSFINADLAKVYGVENVANDSKLRKVVFRDGRRGGFLGMGAFLTLTADTSSTSPIHRAVYVMENFMGIHPAPPPADVEITEPDVRSARTIREVLAAHQSDATCATCHRNIDPFGYAFENFDPIGAWRDHYVVPEVASSEKTNSPADQRNVKGKANRRRAAAVKVEIPIDASATFPSGAEYQDIRQFRKLMSREANRRRFVRRFVTKLLTYANGIEPDNFTEIEAIVEASQQHDYKILETIAAVVHSPLFREARNP